MNLNLVKEVVSRAYPVGSEVTLNHGEVSPEKRYFVISGSQGPRWIVPQNPRYGLPVMRQWLPQRTSSRVKWTALIRVYQAGLLGMMPGVFSIGVSGSNNIDWTELWWTDKNSPAVVTHIGFPGVLQKGAVTFVDTASCRARMILKVPLDPLAVGKILYEADVLSMLTQHAYCISPKPLFVNKEKGIAAQEVIFGRPSGTKFTKAHLQFLNKLRGDGRETSLRRLTEKMAANLERLTCIDDKTEIILRSLFKKTNDPTTFNTVWAHGDFSAINIIWINKNKIIAIDWEDFNLRAPPLWDIFYYFFSRLNAFGKQLDILSEIRNNPFTHEYIKSFNFDNVTVEKLYILFLGSFLMIKLEEGDYDYAEVFKKEILLSLKTIK